MSTQKDDYGLSGPVVDMILPREIDAYVEHYNGDIVKGLTVINIAGKIEKFSPSKQIIRGYNPGKDLYTFIINDKMYVMSAPYLYKGTEGYHNKKILSKNYMFKDEFITKRIGGFICGTLEDNEPLDNFTFRESIANFINKFADMIRGTKEVKEVPAH